MWRDGNNLRPVGLPEQANRTEAVPKGGGPDRHGEFRAPRTASRQLKPLESCAFNPESCRSSLATTRITPSLSYVICARWSAAPFPRAGPWKLAIEFSEAIFLFLAPPAFVPVLAWKRDVVALEPQKRDRLVVRGEVTGILV